MLAAAWPPIDVDEHGVACITGSRIKVIEIALDRLAYHWDADEIRRQHPELSLGQIHAALAYYYEHQAECDRQIEVRRLEVAQIRHETEKPALQARVKAHVGP
jgi:uncharacterized protein (DUF433 family)